MHMNYSQIMSPRPPLPQKVGGHDPPSSYGSAAPAQLVISDTSPSLGTWLADCTGTGSSSQTHTTENSSEKHKMHKNAHCDTILYSTRYCSVIISFIYGRQPSLVRPSDVAC